MTDVLRGRSAVITGASQGLGLAIARAYVEAGARVLICSRDTSMLERAREELAELAGSGEAVHSVAADVSKPADVKRLAERALTLFGRVQILVNNAGVYGPMGSIDAVDWTEWVRAVEINVYGSVLPVRALLPQFKEQRYGKIIQLSGGGATNPLPRITAYAASKAAIVRFAESLAVDVREHGIDVNAMAPGALDTRLLDEALRAGPERLGAAFHDRMLRVKEGAATPLETGAALGVFLASAASDGITGRLISAAWDPWEELPQHRSDLDGTDVYTLRRIVPADRGLPWGRR